MKSKNKKVVEEPIEKEVSKIDSHLDLLRRQAIKKRMYEEISTDHFVAKLVEIKEELKDNENEHVRLLAEHRFKEKPEWFKWHAEDYAEANQTLNIFVTSNVLSKIIEDLCPMDQIERKAIHKSYNAIVNKLENKFTEISLGR